MIENKITQLLRASTRAERKARAHAMLRKLNKIQAIVKREMRNEAR